MEDTEQYKNLQFLVFSVSDRKKGKAKHSLGERVGLLLLDCGGARKIFTLRAPSFVMLIIFANEQVQFFRILMAINNCYIFLTEI